MNKKMYVDVTEVCVDWDDPECIHTKLVDFTQIKTIL